MTEKASLQKYIELLEAKKSQTLVSLQKKIVFNVSGFYEFILLHLESLASSDACLDELNSSLESEIAKGIDFYHISLLAALSESFNLQSVFPFLGAKKRRKAQPKPIPDNSRQPVDEQSMDGSENYASDYSGMIECEINTGDDADSLASDDKSDQVNKRCFTLHTI